MVNNNIFKNIITINNYINCNITGSHNFMLYYIGNQVANSTNSIIHNGIMHNINTSFSIFTKYYGICTQNNYYFINTIMFM